MPAAEVDTRVAAPVARVFHEHVAHPVRVTGDQVRRLGGEHDPGAVRRPHRCRRNAVAPGAVGRSGDRGDSPGTHGLDEHVAHPVRVTGDQVRRLGGERDPAAVRGPHRIEGRTVGLLIGGAGVDALDGTGLRQSRRRGRQGNAGTRVPGRVAGEHRIGICVAALARCR